MTNASAESGDSDRPVSDDLPLDRLGHYQILERIGSGGMGDVYKGYEAKLERYVAIKVLPSALARDEDFVRRFQAEATAVAKLTHANVVPIHFIGQDAGHHFFAMQFIEGERWASALPAGGGCRWSEAAAIVEQCLAGLEAAHAQGLVHRDVKPGNILLDRTSAAEAVLVDFGLVRQIGADRAVDGQRRRDGHGRLHRAGAGPRAEGRWPQRHLLARRDVLPNAGGRLPFMAETPTAMIFQHAYEAPFPLARRRRTCRRRSRA